MPDARDPVADLKRIAFLLEAMQEPSYRVRVFRTAAAILAGIGIEEIRERAASGRLRELPGIGEVTERTVLESLRGEAPVYMRRLESTEGKPQAQGAAELRAALKGDLHAHTDASDGHATIREMAEAAIELGHEYLVISDHSPRLTVANGLSTERLMLQLDEIALLNAELAPFHILTGIEVDINEDGSLDQAPEVLSRLDVVVGSSHSQLRMEAAKMTRVSVDSDAHYTGQLAWVRVGCERAFLCGVKPEMIVNAMGADHLLAWTRSHEAA
ncbi:MAG: PHP domain-containing protein [Chloroflexi bacterium]|nr:PHP domain-containing protein [Chloroflexota bacterium]